MSEDMGPYQHYAPLSVLNALTPTDHQTALEWRERVAQHHEQRKAMRGLKDKDQVVLSTPLRFTSGHERDTFTIRRQVIRGGRKKVVLTDGGFQPFSIPNWQDLVVAIVRGGERIESPLSLKGEENRYVEAVDSLHMRGSSEVRAEVAEHYGIKGSFRDLRHMARAEFRRGDLFAPALAGV